MNSKQVQGMVRPKGTNNLLRDRVANNILSHVSSQATSPFPTQYFPSVQVAGRGGSTMEGRPGDPLIRTNRINMDDLSAMQKAGMGQQGGGGLGGAAQKVMQAGKTGMQVGQQVGRTIQDPSGAQAVGQVAQAPGRALSAAQRGVTKLQQAGHTQPAPPPTGQPASGTTPAHPTTPPTPVSGTPQPTPPGQATPQPTQPTVKGFAVVPGGGGLITILKDPTAGEDLNKGIMLMGSGGHMMPGEMGRSSIQFMGTPWEAKALELEAEELKCRAECEELPDPLSTEAKDLKVWEKQMDKKRGIRAKWFRLCAELRLWQAKKLRGKDKMQKGMAAEMACYGPSNDSGFNGLINFFLDTPFQAEALNLLAKDAEVSAKLKKFPPGRFVGDTYIDPDSKAKESLRQDSRNCEADYYRLQAKALRWMAKEMRKHDKGQK